DRRHRRESGKHLTGSAQRWDDGVEVHVLAREPWSAVVSPSRQSALMVPCSGSSCKIVAGAVGLKFAARRSGSFGRRAEAAGSWTPRRPSGAAAVRRATPPARASRLLPAHHSTCERRQG